MKLPGIRLVPVEFEVGGETAAEGAEALQQFLPRGLAGDGEGPGIGDVDFDLVALLERKCLDDGGGESNGEAVAPFGDLHEVRVGYTENLLYII